jgi:hypothetical protein
MVEYKSHAKERGALVPELYVVQSTLGNDPEATTLPDHLAYQRQLEIDGNWYGRASFRRKQDEMQGAGQIIAPPMDETRKLAEDDPTHESGARNFRPAEMAGERRSSTTLSVFNRPGKLR